MTTPLVRLKPHIISPGDPSPPDFDGIQVKNTSFQQLSKANSRKQSGERISSKKDSVSSRMINFQTENERVRTSTISIEVKELK